MAVLFCAVCAFWLTVPVFPSDKPSPILPLSPDEQTAIRTAVDTQQNWQRQIQSAEQMALNAPLKCEAVLSAVGELQKAFAMKMYADARVESILNAQRLARSCADCEFSPDYKSLVRKEATK